MYTAQACSILTGLRRTYVADLGNVGIGVFSTWTTHRARAPASPHWTLPLTVSEEVRPPIKEEGQVGVAEPPISGPGRAGGTSVGLWSTQQRLPATGAVSVGGIEKHGDRAVVVNLHEHVLLEAASLHFETGLLEQRHGPVE